MPPHIEQAADLRAESVSSISAHLRSVRDGLMDGTVACDLSELDDKLGGFSIAIARDRDTRERAYLLAARIYRERGYADSDARLGVLPFDAEPDTLTLLVQDDRGRDVGTISLIFDAGKGLPSDEIYRMELDVLRAQGRRLVEVVRLAIDDACPHSHLLFVRMINFIYVYARRLKGFDDFVIEVNPRHASWYSRLMFFQTAGPQRPCPRVRGAPAVLMRLDLSVMDREVRRVAGKGALVKERSIYPHFYSWLEEGTVAELLARGHKPMSADDTSYFGISGGG